MQDVSPLPPPKKKKRVNILSVPKSFEIICLTINYPFARTR